MTGTIRPTLVSFLLVTFLLSTSQEKHVDFSIDYILHTSGQPERIIFTALFPHSIDFKQQISDVRFQPEPTKTFRDQNSSYAIFAFDNPVPHDTVSITGRAVLSAFDYLRVMQDSVYKFDTLRPQYLLPEKFIESDHPEIREMAEKLKKPDDLTTVKRISDFIKLSMTLNDSINTELGALETLRQSKGSCTDYADLMIALCRACDIPARFAEGFAINLNTPAHDWVEIYTEEYGWIPFDPNLHDAGMASFLTLQPQYIYLTNKRNDSILNNFHYYSYKVWDGKIDSVERRHRFNKIR